MSHHPEGRVGWLGTGRMGLVLVRRLLDAGLDVCVYNRTRARAEPLAADGAKVVQTAADLAVAPIVFVMVGTSADLVEALLGPAGLMAAAQAPAIVVDLSTVSVEASRQVRQELGSGRLVMRAGIGLVAVLVQHHPVGVLGRKALSDPDGLVRAAGCR